MAKPPMPVGGNGIPQPYPQSERDMPGNGSFGFVPLEQGDEGAQKGNREPWPSRQPDPQPISNLRKGGR